MSVFLLVDMKINSTVLLYLVLYRYHWGIACHSRHKIETVIHHTLPLSIFISSTNTATPSAQRRASQGTGERG